MRTKDPSQEELLKDASKIPVGIKNDSKLEFVGEYYFRGDYKKCYIQNGLYHIISIPTLKEIHRLKNLCLNSK